MLTGKERDDIAQYRRAFRVQVPGRRPAFELRAMARRASVWLIGNSSPARVTKTLGDIRAELESLEIVNGKEYVLTMSLANQSQTKTIWVAISTDLSSKPKVALNDPNGNAFACDAQTISGVEYASYAQYGYGGPGFNKATEIKPGTSTTATVKFFPTAQGQVPSPGICNLQMEILLSYDFRNNVGRGTTQVLIAKIEAQ
jgi:hypothetical protein